MRLAQIWLFQLCKNTLSLRPVHYRIEKLSGTVTFEEINALEARDANGSPLTPLAREDLPPATISLLTYLETIFRQTLGAMGKGTKVFIFNAGDVDACKEGELSVPLAGETYTWKTPIPGCVHARAEQ
jgi:hypothetical protein